MLIESDSNIWANHELHIVVYNDTDYMLNQTKNLNFMLIKPEHKICKIKLKKLNNNIEQEIVSKLNNLAWIKFVFNKK